MAKLVKERLLYRNGNRFINRRTLKNMKTTKNLKHLIQVDAFGIRTKIKAFQKPRRDTRPNKR